MLAFGNNMMDFFIVLSQVQNIMIRTIESDSLNLLIIDMSQ